MKLSNVVLALAFVGLLALVFIHVSLHISHHSSPLSLDGAASSDVSRLLGLVHAQNATIAELTVLIESSRKQSDSFSLLDVIRKKDTQLRELKEELVRATAANASLAKCPALSAATQLSQRPPTGMDEMCERLYGLTLVENWRSNAQTWCESGPKGIGSKLVCFPYHQTHKRNDGRPPDMFCYATNVFIDFSKVTGNHASQGKPPLGQQYYDFQPGSLFSDCKKTSQFRPSLFMPHHAQQMSSFKAEAPLPKKGSYVVEETATYLLARDEDCENSFHSTADFMNMHLVMLALNQAPSATQVMLFDRHSDGPYVELLTKAFAGGQPPIRKEKYAGGKVLFRKLIFHLESPAGLIFPKVYNLKPGGHPEPLRCRNAGLFLSYSRFVLEAFGLWDVPPPPIPQVVLSLRHRTGSKNVGRILANEQEVVSVLREGNLMNLEVVDTAKMSYGEQLALIRRTNVLVGVHGAGLMLIMFAANEAVLVEVHPSYRQDRHFRHAARMMGRHYLPMRSSVREACQGSSDNVVVPVDEFRKTMDGALRLARNFDDGISECGLTCPPGVLALDVRLQPYYKPTDPRGGARVDTSFPC